LPRLTHLPHLRYLTRLTRMPRKKMGSTAKTARGKSKIKREERQNDGGAGPEIADLKFEI
jgi:hypothetical protein